MADAGRDKNAPAPTRATDKAAPAPAPVDAAPAPLPLARVTTTKAGIAFNLEPATKAAAQRLADAIALGDIGLCEHVTASLVNALSEGSGPREDELNHALAMIADLAPKDALEVMLTVQMVAAHVTAMRFVGRINRSEWLPQMESAEKITTRHMLFHRWELPRPLAVGIASPSQSINAALAAEGLNVDLTETAVLAVPLYAITSNDRANVQEVCRASYAVAA